jgi:2-keto-3-deoxy-L-rhamnonate aldolase RhmA
VKGAELREKMKRGEQVYGTMLSRVRNPRWAGVYAPLGFDFVIVDTEHSPIGRSPAADLAAAFLGAGICPIIRVKDSEPHATVMALDAGFHGVLVPYCETADEVRDVVNAARLRPLKGALYERARDTGEFPSPEAKAFLEERNKDVVVVIGIESLPAVEHLDEILGVDGIDAVFIGPNDLSLSLGIPGNYSHHRFVDAVEHIISTAARRGIPAGGHFYTQELIQFWIGKGSRWILYNSDIRALTEGYRSAMNAFRNTTVGDIEYTH